jgi:hypothetical protein
MTLGSVKRSSIGAMVIMTGNNFQRRDDICKAILEIIADYQPITTKDIWYELGEDDRFKDGITLAEVNETLFQLEKQKMIVRVEDEKWKIKTIVAKRPRISPV